MVVDQEMFKNFVAEQQQNAELVELDQRDRSAAIQHLKEKVLDKPKYFMTLAKISKFFRLNRGLDVDEALDLIMGRITKPKTKSELLDEKFDEVVQLKGLGEQFAANPRLYRQAKSLFDAYISSSTVKDSIDKGDFTALFHSPELNYEEFKAVHEANVAQPVLQHVRDYINTDKLRNE
jgi:hypothetical protein